MEYVFGVRGQLEVLKTKGETHTDLTGYQQIERSFSGGEAITDNFRVVRRLESKTDPAGNCYDWYEIDRHYRVEDKSAQAAQANARTAANLDYLSMMAGIDLPDGEEGTDDG